VLKDIRPDVNKLIVVAKALQTTFEKASNENAKSKQAALDAIAEFEKVKKQIDSEIAVTKASIAKGQVEISVDEKNIQELRKQLNNAYDRVRELNAHNKELETWFWVPGYGQYLAGRAIDENYIKNLPSVLTNQAREVAADANGKRRRMYDTQAQLNQLKQELTKLKRTIDATEAKAKELEEGNKVLAGRVAEFQNLVDYYYQVQTEIEGIGDNLESVRSLTRRLKDTVTFTKVSGQVEQVSLTEALYRLAADYDDDKTITN
jgi:DNA repair exonuclease SbcCD ATPase subunit